MNQLSGYNNNVVNMYYRPLTVDAIDLTTAGQYQQTCVSSTATKQCVSALQAMLACFELSTLKPYQMS